MRYAFFLLCLSLAGCATLDQRAAPTAPIGDAFHLFGRVAVKYGDQAASGKIDWQHDSASDELLLSTPLGQGVARIVRSEGAVSLTTSDHKQYQASDVESLTEQVLGWRLPLAGLPDWVRGRATPGAAAQTKLDQAQRLAELRQSGWLVEYLAYEDRVPRQLRLSRADVEIRLVIDQWGSAP